RTREDDRARLRPGGGDALGAPGRQGDRPAALPHPRRGAGRRGAGGVAMRKPFRELLAGSAAAFNDHDPEAWLELWNADCEWHPFLTAREEGDPGYHGPNGIRAWFEDVDEM